MTEMRQCPVCGQATDGRRCSRDDAATVRPVPSTAAAIGPGAVLDGRVRITEVIGAGGFARVFGAVDDLSGRELAVKVMSKAYIAADADNIRRFVREAEITSRLVHGNTIRVFDVGQTADGQLLLLMERLRGHTLTHRLRHLRHDQALMPPNEAVTIGVQVLNSLLEAHGSGLVHRDLKPDNIFLHRVSERGRIVKVIDFGIAHRDGSEMTQVGQVLGTPAYMSPEQARGSSIDGRADLYSLGIILYQCLTGRIPYPEEDNALMTMMHHVLSPIPDPREFRPELTEDFAAVIRRALAKEAQDRFADAGEMRTALRALRCFGITQRPAAVPVASAGTTARPRRAPRSAAQIALGRTRSAPPPSVRPSTPAAAAPAAAAAAGATLASPELRPAPPPPPSTGRAAPPPPPLRRLEAGGELLDFDALEIDDIDDFDDVDDILPIDDATAAPPPIPSAAAAPPPIPAAAAAPPPIPAAAAAPTPIPAAAVAPPPIPAAAVVPTPPPPPPRSASATSRLRLERRAPSPPRASPPPPLPSAEARPKVPHDPSV
jgi:tRNA A-37 threonylcarbamoyl transferase component Bud32